MPPPPRENRRGSGGRHGEEEFVLYLQGIPPHCRWQELKDYIRQSALHIRQAVVYDDAHGCPTGLGQIIVKNADEAWRTFRRLSTEGWDGQTLTVTLARASSPTKPIAGPTCSPPRMLQARMHTGYMRGSGPSDPMTPAPSYPPPQEPVPAMGYNRPGPTIMENHAWDAMPWAPNMTDPTAAYMAAAPVIYLPYFDPTCFPSYPYQLPMFSPLPQDMHNKPGMFRPYQPPYPMNESTAYQYPDWYSPPHPPSNHGRTSVTVTIHSNTGSAPITAASLENHIRQAGTLLHCDVHNRPHPPGEHDRSPPRDTTPTSPNNNNTAPVTATVTFRTEDEALRAVQLYDGTTLLGSRLSVHLADFSSHLHPNPQQRYHHPSESVYSSSSSSSSSSLSSLSSSSSSSPSSSEAATRSNSISPNPPTDGNQNDGDDPAGERFEKKPPQQQQQQQRPAPQQRDRQPLVVNGSVMRHRETSTSTGVVGVVSLPVVS
ncbi:hypothetical protein VTN31DRAFT_1824 [Thermomyces dupontii]|uniref:uncharacterized protein n=1 Tax=Talaromyces thermophilus TaxID=28565 RepID=UPI00374262A0